MSKILTLMLSIILLSSIAVADILCTGSTCYQSENVPLRIEEIEVNAILNIDESVDYTETIGLSYNFSKINSSVGVLVPEFYLPVGSKLDPEIRITDQIDGNTLKRVYFFDENCTDEFIYNEDENSLELCIEPHLQARLMIQAKILSKYNLTSYEQFTQRSDHLANPLIVSLPPNDYEYPLSIEISGGNGVAIQNVTNDTCADTSGYRDGLSFIPATNGIICQGTVKPSGNKTTQKILSVEAINQRKLDEEQQQKLSNLQMEDINASIRASNAAVSTNNATYMYVYMTVFIIILTGINIYVLIVGNREKQRTNRPGIKTKIDTSHGDKLVLKVINIGKTVALDVNIEYTIQPNGGTHSWYHHLLQENEAIHFTPKDFKDTTLTEFLGKYDKIMINATWKGLDQRIYKEKYEIKLKDYKKSRESNIHLKEKED